MLNRFLVIKKCLRSGYLREREVVHFQRFGEALRGVQDKLSEKKFYMNDMMPYDENNCIK